MSLKRILAVLIGALAVCAVCAIGASAATWGDYQYNVLDDGTVDIYYYKGSEKNLSIPKTINGKTVTSISSGTFYGCTGVNTITIPDSVTRIEMGAFSQCPDLTEINVASGNKAFSSENGVLFTKAKDYLICWPCAKKGSYTVPSSVICIVDGAFSFCDNITSVTIPDSVEYINPAAFYYCKGLTSIKLPNKLMYIEVSTFYGCTKLTSITIPKSVKRIDSSAFYECNAIKDVYYTGTQAQWNNINIGSYNSCLTDATRHYNAVVPVSGLTLKGRASDALRLGWTKNTSADGYIVEQKVGSTWKRIAKITNNSTTEYRISGLAAGTAYSFRVMAYKMDGSKAYYSEYFGGSWRTYPSNISGLTLKGRAADALRIGWTKNASADGYIVEQKVGSTWKRIAKITNNATVEYRVSGLAAGTAYSFRVRAYKMSGSTALYSGYTSGSWRTNPSAASGLTVKGKATNAIRIGWNKNTSAAGYIIEQQVNGSWVRVAKITNNSTTEYRITGLKTKTSYNFRVITYKMSGSTALYGAAKTINAKTT
ncbi:MAG: leucine-rich repeat protein [Eubacterium sp.]|nr:leucine-rich repeat protein [Eubacterium sp.]